MTTEPKRQEADDETIDIDESSTDTTESISAEFCKIESRNEGLSVTMSSCCFDSKQLLELCLSARISILESKNGGQNKINYV